ncbi:hypothetical protein ACJX0J_027901, partial [Zea mays]
SNYIKRDKGNGACLGSKVIILHFAILCLFSAFYCVSCNQVLLVAATLTIGQAPPLHIVSVAVTCEI